MDKGAERARPALFAMLEDELSHAQDAAYIALGKIAVEERAQTKSVILSRLDHVTELTVEQSSAAFLEIEDYSFRNDPRIPSTRIALGKIIATQSNTKIQRAAIRALFVLGPGGGPDMARALCKAMRKDRQHHVAELLKSIDASDPATGQALLEAMQESLSSDYEYYPLVIAETLLKSGTQARAATPWIIKAMQKIEFLSRPRDGYSHYLAVYIRLLKSIGSVEPTILPALLALLNPDLPFMKKSGSHGDQIKYEIFLAIAAMDLPLEGPLHREILTRVMESLQSKDYSVLMGASEVAGKLKSKEVVPLLLRVLNAKEEAEAVNTRPERFTQLGAAIAAMKALGELGLLAKDALPIVSEIAGRQAPESSFNVRVSELRGLILSARKAKASIENAVAEKTQ